MTRGSRWPARAIALGGILLLALTLRSAYLFTPLLDNHRWRQVDTASMARGFHEDGLNPLRPKVLWGGRDGVVESEFPLLPFLMALLYRVFGEHDWFGRAIVLAFSLGVVWMAYRLGARLLGPEEGLAAAFLVAVSPSAVYYGRTVMPDSVMLFFSLAALSAFLRYFCDGGWRALALGTACLAATGLVKLPGIVVIAPMGAAAVVHFRGRRWSAPAAAGGVAVALMVTAAWYLHANALFDESGLTFGILGHPARTYPPWISAGPWDTTFSKWGSLAHWTSWEFYERIIGRLYSLHLLPWGAAGAMVGALTWRVRGSGAIVGTWTAAFAAFIMVAAEGHLAHDYYQLPLVPIGAMAFGVAAGPLVRFYGQARVAGRVAAATAVLAVAALSFYFSGVTRTHFRTGDLDYPIADAGAALGDAAPGDDLVVAVDNYGVTSPMLLYFAHKRGWSFDIGQLTPELLESLSRGHQARYFATTIWPAVAEQRPELVRYLDGRQRVDTGPTLPDLAVFDLRRPR